MKVEQNVWKRIEFENYKRETKQERMNSLREKVLGHKKITKKAKNKCFKRLINDSKRRLVESIERDKSCSLNRSQGSHLKFKNNSALLNKSSSQYNKSQTFQNESSNNKSKKEQEEQKLKDIENDLDQLCKRKKLKRGPLNEYEKNLIVKRQWDYYRQKEQRMKEVEQAKQLKLEKELKTYFKPDTRLSKRSLNVSRNSRSLSKSKQRTLNTLDSGDSTSPIIEMKHKPSSNT